MLAERDTTLVQVLTMYTAYTTQRYRPSCSLTTSPALMALSLPSPRRRASPVATSCSCVKEAGQLGS